MRESGCLSECASHDLWATRIRAAPETGRQPPLSVPGGDCQAAKRRGRTGRGCRCEGRAESVLVEDWDGGGVRAVPLDPRKTGVQAGLPRPIHLHCH